MCACGEYRLCMCMHVCTCAHVVLKRSLLHFYVPYLCLYFCIFPFFSLHSGEKEPNGGRYRIRYKTLREASAHQLEGLALLLKTMKSAGVVAFDGVVVVDDNAVITLLPQ